MVPEVSCMDVKHSNVKIQCLDSDEDDDGSSDDMIDELNYGKYRKAIREKLKKKQSNIKAISYFRFKITDRASKQT